MSRHDATVAAAGAAGAAVAGGKDYFTERTLKSLKVSLGKLWRRRTVTITEYDPTYKCAYLGNVLTGWAKGEGCVEKPLSTLWKNYTGSTKADVQMKVSVTHSGLKAVTKEHGLTEYWSHRVTYCAAPAAFPRIFCWVYRHEGRKLKQELRCHAVLCAKEGQARRMATQLRAKLAQALHEFKRDKICRQNARLSLANCVYENPSLPRRKILLSTGSHNYRPPLERSKSAPKLMAIEESLEEGLEEVLDNRLLLRMRMGWHLDMRGAGGESDENSLQSISSSGSDASHPPAAPREEAESDESGYAELMEKEYDQAEKRGKDGRFHVSICESEKDSVKRDGVNDGGKDGSHHISFYETEKDSVKRDGVNDEDEDGTYHNGNCGIEKNSVKRDGVNDEDKDGRHHISFCETEIDSVKRDGVDDGVKDGRHHIKNSGTEKDYGKAKVQEKEGTHQIIKSILRPTNRNSQCVQV